MAEIFAFVCRIFEGKMDSEIVVGVLDSAGYRLTQIVTLIWLA